MVTFFIIINKDTTGVIGGIIQGGPAKVKPTYIFAGNI